ncbi:MAG: transketolase [Chloroflexi bacterium]|nr:transketolase [Chloroflexota bacterium]MCH7654944.1 transketolase [Chloroflexota bacterium]
MPSVTASRTTAKLDELSINTIRFLAVDAVQKAGSGHPGAPMGAAPMAYILWDRFLKHNPADSRWPDRDRFVLSAGHASMLLYALLHLSGYPLSLEEIRQFRQWGSQTPGHPEYGHTPGAEMTTGPLGQGFASGIGMAVAERWLGEHYNRPDHRIIDHRVYAIVSDGDLMEGVSSEAASLAGTLGLGKIVYLYDDNGISIEGDTDIAFTEDVPARFRAYGWHVAGPVDGNDLDGIEAAIAEARAETGRPSLVVVHSVIGYGSPNKANTGGVHGEPLGEDEVRLTRERLGWENEPFVIPPDALDHMRGALGRGADAQRDWEARLEAYRAAYPAEAAQLEADLSGDLAEGWADGLDGLFDGDTALSTRDAGNRAMNAIAERVHALTGGSADLAPSTKTLLKSHADVGLDATVDHNMHFGVREHAMGSIAVGMALHGGVIPYTATFFIFSDYMRPPMRLAALMGQRAIFVFTHDSVALGEDGPTHQPIEQLIGLRAVPNLVVIRPADATETAEAWKAALERRDGPTALVLTRQGMPVLDRTAYASAAGLQRGGYVLREAPGDPQAILIATGSEVQIALDAAKLLDDRGVAARVVSLPSWEIFDAQPASYRESVLPRGVRARVSVEAAGTLGWERYVGLDGASVGVDRFGASASYKRIYQELGLTPEHVADEAEALVKQAAL